MTAAIEIPIEPIATSKLKGMNLENLPFGKHFSDHMLEADFIDGQWTNISIRPYSPLTLSPSLAALHYGQSIFEGIKAYKDQQSRPFIFRPYDNFLRFNTSAERMQMPSVPAEIFMDGMMQLIKLDQDWIPSFPDHSLYIRPFMFSTDEMIGVRPSDTYKFMIILSPTGPYYSAPMRIWVEEKYVRAVSGGVGYAKAAGNYGGAMYATAQAKLKGFDQVLWTDPIEHKYVQECGTMNVFFIIGNKAITPGLEEGTILGGVTRMSVMTLLTEMGLEVEERDLGMDEVLKAHQNGSLREVFGTGTAATISFIKELCYKGDSLCFDTDKWTIAPALKQNLAAIREGKMPDTHGWMVPVS
ncbi:MAG: branched-chain amino acid aminotransferase [Chitinophagaceae bacterium]|jgi:branched-chain amino acid aminotransferase